MSLGKLKSKSYINIAIKVCFNYVPSVAFQHTINANVFSLYI